MRDVPFVDAHIHLWDLDRLRYPWLTPPFTDDGPNGSVAAIAATYLPADYRADATGWRIAGTVHVEAGAHPAHALDETRWLDGLDDGPDGIVAFAALDAPDIAEQLAAQATCGKLRGIRHIVNWHPDARRSYCSRDVTGDAGWTAGFAALERHGFSFDLQCYPAQMLRVAALAERHPGVPLIVNHLGMPVLSDPDGLGAWRRGLATLAALPHAAIKISGFGFARRPWTVEHARPFVREAIDLFGSRRCMVASDFPTDKLFGTFDATLEAYADIIADLTQDERRDLWGRNANRLYRLGLDL